MKGVIHKLPQEFLHKLKKIYPGKHTKIAETFISKKPTTFRINYLKGDLRNLRRMMQEQRVKFKELSFPKGAFILKGNLRDLQRTKLYQQGYIFVQNLSSMIPVIALEPKDGEKILDLCAAPGAKTSQIASLALQAQITAIEKIRTRYYKLLANLKTQGVENVETLILDSIWVRKKFPEEFDKILADVPCSAEGRFLLSNPKTYKYWKLKKVKEMMHKQKKLMHSAFFALKEGGELVYSTCTFSPEENEVIIDWFINKFKGKVEVMPLKFPLPNSVNGLIHWNGRRLATSMKLAKRIIPNELMEGFYVAKIKKIAY